MKAFSLLAGLCLATSLQMSKAQDWAGYEKLPPVQDRTVRGQWDLGHSCTGALISGGGKTYWAQVCIINTGCCNGIYGYVLRAINSNVYTDKHRKTTYAIQKDGSMRIKTPDGAALVYSAKLGPDNPSWADLAPWQRE